MSTDIKFINNPPKSGFTIQFLDNLMNLRKYEEAERCISQMFAKDRFSKIQLVELFIRAAFIYNRRDNAPSAERFARKGLAVLVTLKEIPHYETKCWRFLEQICKSLSKQDRDDEKMMILRGACDLKDLCGHDKTAVLYRYASCLISAKEFAEAKQCLEKAKALADTPVLLARTCYLSAICCKETDAWSEAITSAEVGIKLLRESGITQSHLLSKLNKELFKAQIGQELMEL